MSGTEVTIEVRIVVRSDAEAAPLNTVANRLAAALRSSLEGRGEVVPSLPHLLLAPRSADARLRIEARSRIVRVDGAVVELTKLEYDLLLHFCRNPYKVHRRADLMVSVWGLPAQPPSRTVDVHIRRLRSKFGPDLPLITTVRGVGYRVDDTDLFVIEHDVPEASADDAPALSAHQARAS